MHKSNAQRVGSLLIACMPLWASAQQQSTTSPSQPETSGQSSSMSKAEIKAQQKAQSKAARKQARQAKNAQLKSLQQHGYGPAANPNQYPENLNNAERKAMQQKPASAEPASSK